MNRRNFLKGGGAVLILVTGGIVYRAYDRGVFSAGTGPAYEPWQNWQSEMTSGPLRLMHAAILAANAHNTQPWLFRVQPERIEVFADPSRHLGAFDPFRREMFLSLGCALENLLVAARATGFHSRLSAVDGRLVAGPQWRAPLAVAVVELQPAPARLSPLYDAIPLRHTDRAPYRDDKPISPDLLQELTALGEDDPSIKVFWYTAPEQRRRFAKESLRATEAIVADARMVDASQKWFRDDWRKLQESRDGPEIDAAGLPPVVRVLAKLLPAPDAKTGHEYWLKAVEKTNAATAAFGIIAVRDKFDRAQTLAAGRLWQRMHLLATLRGLAMAPTNMMAERDDRERELGLPPETGTALTKLMGDSGWEATFNFRAGYPTVAAPASARRALRDVLIT